MKIIGKPTELKGKNREKESAYFLFDFDDKKNLFASRWSQWEKIILDVKGLNKTVYGEYGLMLEALEKRVKRLESPSSSNLRIVRPHAGEIPTKLFNKVVSKVEELQKHYNNIRLRLDIFVSIKDLLSECIARIGSTNNYRRKAFIVIFDAIKHAYAEDLTDMQVETLADTIKPTTATEPLNKDQFRNIYRSLLKGGFRILPEPAKASTVTAR